MKNRDRLVALRPTGRKGLSVPSAMENGQPVERVISATKAASISRKNRPLRKRLPVR